MTTTTKTIHDISRQRLQGAVEAPANTLADEAAVVLGYSAQGQTVVEAGQLATALADLDIEVLNEREVLTYQFEQLARESIKRIGDAYTSLKNGWRNDLAWTAQPIDKFTSPIPDYVLNKAIQIKKALPEVELLVESLGVDPFLIARLKKSSYDYEGYYVEVWDETSFAPRS